jgi:hypothetical protein
MEKNENKELIAFYNVENLFSPDKPPIHKLDPTISGLRNWDERKYKTKLFKITEVFELMQKTEGILPMLIGLSEIQGQKPLDELIKLPPFNSNYGVVHYDSLDERGVDVALLFDKSKIEIISSEPITYFFEIEDNNPANYDTTRDILHCKIKFEEEIINIFVLHLPSKREKDINKPKRQFILNDVRAKVLDLLSKSDEKIIICGDFNENPDDENINNLLYDDHLNKIFINPSLDLFKNNNFSTFYYKNGLLFDQMILSNHFFDQNAPLKFKESKVFNHQKLANREGDFKGKPFRTYAGTRYLGGYSDHFPVITEFSKTI